MRAIFRSTALRRACPSSWLHLLRASCRQRPALPQQAPWQAGMTRPKRLPLLGTSPIPRATSMLRLLPTRRCLQATTCATPTATATPKTASSLLSSSKTPGVLAGALPPSLLARPLFSLRPRRPMPKATSIFPSCSWLTRSTSAVARLPSMWAKPKRARATTTSPQIPTWASTPAVGSTLVLISLHRA